MKLASASTSHDWRKLPGADVAIPVRRSDDGGEFWLYREISADCDGARQTARLTDSETPGWAKCNPVVRYAKVRLLAVE